jgi:hypothetical protein
VISIQYLFESIRLYHCSYQQNLKQLDPTKVESSHIPDKTPSVYATNDKSYASGFCFPYSDDMGIVFGSVNKGPWTLKIPRRHLHLLNKPCSMYEVSPSTFKNLNISVPEFISYSKVKVLDELKFRTGKECMGHYDTVIIVI